jgi:hypothetical protein
MEMAEPITGWDMSTVLSIPFAAAHDINGKLHHHISGLLGKFHRRLNSKSFDFRFSNLTPGLLTGTLAHEEPESYASVDTGHYADIFIMQDLSIEVLVASFGALLQNPVVNPHATLITLHRLGVEQMVRQGKFPHQRAQDLMRTALLCKPEAPEDVSQMKYLNDARFLVVEHSVRHVRNGELWFAE